MSAPHDDRDETASLRGLDDVIAGARPDEPVALRLARARVAGALFGESAGLGRFHVLEQLGRGGMGVVYAAYDPQLDRGVALKTVRVTERGHDAVLAEAKALAKLAHPNVVPVFDVGIEGDDVYIVMELVRGETLRTWVKDRPVGDVLDAYRQAGLALAAAHAAGLVHRDFKPDNAIVGSDGRVRVVDFGLACEASEVRSAAGTPRYMAPEQAAGGAVTPAADQYSLCVSLAEALGPEPPRWVAAILERGSAADPKARFASIGELVRALGRDPARIRRNRVIAALAPVVVAAAFVVGRTTLDSEAVVCDGGGAEIAQAWPPIARAAALVRVAALSPYGHELAPRLQQQLDEHAGRWAEQRRDACLARRRGMQSEAQFDRRMACLDRSRAALAGLADVVARSDAAALAKLALAVTALPDPVACSNALTLASGVAPPSQQIAPRVGALRAEIERSRIEIAAGKLDDARTRTSKVVAEARELAYPPLLAEALLVAGHIMLLADDQERAVPTLSESLEIATAGDAAEIAVEAGARRAWLLGTNGDVVEAFDGIRLLEALASRPAAAGFPRALLHSNLGAIEIARGKRAAARAAYERALADARGVTGRGSAELITISRVLATLTDDPVERDRLFVEAERALAKLVDANHPEALETRLRRVQWSAIPLSEAAAVTADVCARQELHATLAARAARCWADLGDLRQELGDTAGTIAALERAVRIDPVRAGTDYSYAIPDAAPYLRLWRGDVGGAVQGFETVIKAMPARTPDEDWYRTEERAELLLGLGRAYRRAGRTRDAQQTLQGVVADLEPIAENVPSMSMARHLARARAELAHTGLRSVHAITGARAATAWLRQAGGNPDEIVELEQWLKAVVAADSPR